MRAAMLVGTAILTSLSVASKAQEASTPVAVDEGLAEIVVTAQRKVESSQKAAVPLDVVQGSTLLAAGATQLDRLNQIAPALSIEPTSTGNLIFLRGVGNFTVVTTSDPAIAFNYDGVYIGRPTSSTGMFYDLDRVEILKGPQGILYGRNATGGAINVLPVQPKFDGFSGYASASFGSKKRINAEGAINLPVGERTALRISAATASHDGYLRDGTTDEKTNAARIQLKTELTSALTLRVAADYAHNGGVGNSISYYGRYARNPAVPVSAGPVPGSNYFTFIPANLAADEGVYSAASQAYRQTVPFGPLGSRLQALAPYPYVDNDFYGANAELTLETDAGTLTVIPSWRVADQHNLGSAGAFIYRDFQKDDQYSFEARFTGKQIGIFDYQVGAYYYDETIKAKTNLTISNAANFIDQKLTTTSYAAFGRLTANITDRFRIVGGARYTKDDKSFKQATISAVINCLATNAFGAPNCPTAPQIPYADFPSQYTFPFPAMTGAIPVFVGIPGPTNPPNYLIIRSDTINDRTLKSSRVTWRAALEFDVAPQSLLYVSAETGYRSGGFSSAVGFETYDPEYIDAYTIGMKNRFFNNRLQLNVETFLWDYKNQQVNHVGLDLNGRTANYTQNIGTSQIKGFEIDGRFLVTRSTLLSADLQYLDAKQKKFTYTQGPGNPPLTGCNVSFNAAQAAPYTIDCSGQTSYNSPKWTVNLAAQQTIDFGDYKFVVGADTQHKGSRPIGFGYLPQQSLPSNWTTNAQLAFGPANDHWSIAAFVRNIEDDRIPVYTSTHPSASLLIAGTTPPRTYGLRASVKF